MRNYMNGWLKRELMAKKKIKPQSKLGDGEATTKAKADERASIYVTKLK